MVALEGRAHINRSDIGSSPHWYLRSVDPSSYKRLNVAASSASLTDEQLEAYNEWVRRETIIDNFGPTRQPQITPVRGDGVTSRRYLPSLERRSTR
jgi:hypothetical protein